MKTISLISKSFVKRKERVFIPKKKYKNFLKRSAREKCLEPLTLVNSPPDISHALSSMHRECVYA